MCSTQTRLLPSLALLLTLIVGIHGGGIGKCNEAGGTCINIPKFLRVEGDAFCYETDQIPLTPDQLEDEGCERDAICCKLDKVKYVGKRQCDSSDTPKRCMKRHGGKCQGDCDTIKIDGLCKGASCTCCVQKAKKCSPKPEYEDKDGFCVSKPKYCKKSGGLFKNKGCECKNGDKAHLCYQEKWHWSYEGDGAPEFWKDYFPICGLERQSPIDIISADAVQETILKGSAVTGAEPFDFTLYDKVPTSGADVQNNGHSAVVYWKETAKPFVSGGALPSDYILAQFHFHWGSDSTVGSEHLIDGKAYPIELHLVHFKAEYGALGEAVKYGDGLAVLGIMFEVGDEDNAALKPFVDVLKDIIVADTEVNIPYDMDLMGLLPSNTDSFYRYLGSLTTPSCNEVVVWTVFKEPLQISEAQLEEFRKMKDSYDHAIVDNFRPPQPLNGRTVTEYNAA